MAEEIIVTDNGGGSISLEQPASEEIQVSTAQGPRGIAGASAYAIAVADGFVGDETTWLASLVGTAGEDGDSAYEVAVAAGFVGDEAAWLASLVGATGQDGSGLVETGSFGSPTLISTGIAIPEDLVARLFIAGDGGPVVATIADGASLQELFLFGTNATNTVELSDAANLQLSGPIVIGLGSVLCLHWITGLNKWVEVSRNEIF